MLSTSVFIIFALSFISFGSGYHIKRESGYSQVIRCLNDAFAEANGDVSEGMCYYKVIDPCLDRFEEKVLPGSEPVLDLFVAYMWQELTLVKKLGMCGDVPSADLREYALKSGVMQKLNLHNIEPDKKALCAEKAFLKCFFAVGNEHASYLSQADAYLKCEETQGETCKAPIWKHYHATVDAWRKVFEKNRGKSQ